MNGKRDLLESRFLTGGYIVGGGVISGTLTWTGGGIGNSSVAAALKVATNGLLVMAGQVGGQYDCWGVLTNAGTMQFLSGNMRFVGSCGYNYAILVNLPGALVDLQTDSSIIGYCASTPFTNLGARAQIGRDGDFRP